MSDNNFATPRPANVPRAWCASEIPAGSICNLTWDAGNSRFAIAVATAPASQFVRAVSRIPASTWTDASVVEFLGPCIEVIAGEVLANTDVGAAMVTGASGKAVKGAGTPTLGKYVPVKRANNTTGTVADGNTILVMRYHA